MSDAAVPRWDLTTIYPSLESEPFRAAFSSLSRRLEALETLCDRYDVRRRPDGAIDDAFVARFEEATAAINEIMDLSRTIGSYLSCLTTTDANDESARAMDSRLSNERVRLDRMLTRYQAWVGSSDVDALLSRSRVARDHEYPVRRAVYLVAHQMSEAEEALAAELRPCGPTGWGRLHGQMGALLTARVRLGEEERTLPMSEVRSLGTNPDRDVRSAAFSAEIQAWESVAVPMAAALNGIKGFQSVVRRRRGYEDDVAPTLFSNGLDREVVEAMQAACAESFPDFRRYLRAKAAVMGIERVAWYDLFAPVARTARAWTWPEAEAFIRRNFGRYSDPLEAFAARSFRERWIDAEPRVGKEDGGYCTGVRPGESRIFMNFDGSFSAVSTLAHELGHAYHNLCLGDRLPMQRGTPSTLAETASIFCETLAFESALGDADRDGRLALIDTVLQRDLVVIVDIHSRFLFEKAVFERRADRDLTVTELSELMLDCQRRTYGDAVDPLHPYMWAVKGHYYGPTFYNYPYTFGLLFGLGLYARYEESPDRFRAEYDSFLSRTGLADARTLAAEFGIDLTGTEFWHSGLDRIRREIDEFISLAQPS